LARSPTPRPSVDPVYSEAEVAEMRQQWEQAAKEREFATQLATLTGTVNSLPDQMRAIAKAVALEVIQGQRTELDQRHWSQRPIIINLALLGFGQLLALAGLVWVILTRH
jgi:hypothetical protein